MPVLPIPFLRCRSGFSLCWCDRLVVVCVIHNWAWESLFVPLPPGFVLHFLSRNHRTLEFIAALEISLMPIFAKFFMKCPFWPSDIFVVFVQYSLFVCEIGLTCHYTLRMPDLVFSSQACSKSKVKVNKNDVKVK